MDFGVDRLYNCFCAVTLHELSAGLVPSCAGSWFPCVLCVCNQPISWVVSFSVFANRNLVTQLSDSPPPHPAAALYLSCSSSHRLHPLTLLVVEMQVQDFYLMSSIVLLLCTCSLSIILFFVYAKVRQWRRNWESLAVPPEDSEVQQCRAQDDATTPTSVNYHFTRMCNYKCGFCFHTAKTSFVLPLEEAKRGLGLLKEAGKQEGLCRKVFMSLDEILICYLLHKPSIWILYTVKVCMYVNKMTFK